MLETIATKAIEKNEKRCSPIWQNRSGITPETALQRGKGLRVDRRSAARRLGFDSRSRLYADLPTAIRATWGKGHPVIGFLGEYDALPGLSQKVGTEKEAM